MKRSNRIVLLLGVVLAALAFAGVFYVINQRAAPVSTAPTELPTVYARQNIALGTVITSDMVEARPQAISVRDPNAYGDVGQVVGKTARAEIKKDQIILSTDFTAGAAGSAQDVAHLLEPGLRAISVHVDQGTGVGTLINVGDRVDLVLGLTGDKVPLVTRDATTGALATVSGYNPTTTKVILQNMQVIGTLTPSGAGASNPQPSAGTGGQPEEELVILAVTAQQAEVIKFAQMDGNITLVLRSPKDFVDANGQPVSPPDATTSGVVLKTLIDQYGVLPPQLIPAQNLP